MYKRLLIVSAFLLTGLQGFAQEMYLSISGSNVGVLSGDSRHQYDIWIKPEGSATTGSVQIFDAGLGGAVDLITNENANTVTDRNNVTMDYFTDTRIFHPLIRDFLTRG